MNNCHEKDYVPGIKYLTYRQQFDLIIVYIVQSWKYKLENNEKCTRRVYMLNSEPRRSDELRVLVYQVYLSWIIIGRPMDQLTGLHGESHRILIP